MNLFEKLQGRLQKKLRKPENNKRPTAYNRGFAIRYHSSKLLPTVVTSQTRVPLSAIAGKRIYYYKEE